MSVMVDLITCDRTSCSSPFGESSETFTAKTFVGESPHRVSAKYGGDGVLEIVFVYEYIYIYKYIYIYTYMRAFQLPTFGQKAQIILLCALISLMIRFACSRASGVC